MNSSSWRRYYEKNRIGRVEPDWTLPCALPVDLQQKLAASLSHFQLGETGGGRHLLREASKESGPDDLVALQLFAQEETEHARLLSEMVRRLDGSLISRHWTHSAFRFIRRIGGFQFEIQMLLTAELVGTAYYQLVHAGTNDPVLRSAIGLMLRDEVGHVAFHLERLRHKWRDVLPLERMLWTFQFQIIVLLAVRAAWMDHRVCLSALGHTWLDFSRHARRETIRFLDGLDARSVLNQVRRPAGISVESRAA